MSFKAEIVADSKNTIGNRITTFVVTFPRIILAEFNTHRMLSKNSASSRAIPFAKAVEVVKTHPFIPIAWMKDHTGMQGNQYFTGWRAKVREWVWLAASKAAVKFATKLSNLGVTKQFCNRLLEPFMWHTVIVTGTEWENFFALRAHPAAEIHMQKIAEMMLEAYNQSTPLLLEEGQWHIPFRQQINAGELSDLWYASRLSTQPITAVQYESFIPLAVKISTVMAARTSYTVVGVDQKPMTYRRMLDLHDDMVNQNPKHASPFEHCAKSRGPKENYDEEYDMVDTGNFKGFIQYRKMLAGENQTDSRVLKWVP